MSSPTPKVSNYMSKERSMSYGSPMARQPSWDSVHTLTDSMSKMSVRNPNSNNATSANPPNTNAPGHRRGSASDSSSSSAPIVTPVPSREADAAYNGSNQPGHVTPGYQYRGPNTPGTLGKPDEVLQVDYNLQPRHFIPGSMTSPQPTSATPQNGARANGAPNGAAAPFVPGAFSGNNGFYGQPAGYPGQGGAADNKAAQDMAAQIALNALQSMNAPMQNQAGQPNALNPALAQAAAAAVAAGYNPNLLPSLYGNPLYGNVNGAAPPGAQGFYPGQENMAAAVANAVAQLPPGAFQAALQNVGLAAYPLNGLPGAVPGMNVGMPGMMGVGPGAAGMLSAAGQLQQLQQGGPSANNRKLGLYKTELCRSWEEKGTCRYGPKCQFAHGEDELKRVQRHPKYKTEICRTFWLSGSCPYGKRCCFIHTELPAGENGEKKEDGPTARDLEEALQRERERERAQQMANSDSEQQQTSMLARIRRDPSNNANGANTPSPPMLHQNQGMHQVNGHGTIGSASNANMTPGSGRPTLGALRVDTAAINDTTVPKNSYPYTSNPAMPAPGLSLATDVVRGRLSPVPATAGPDFGRNAAARMEVVGVSPQSGSQTPQPGQRGHLRSVSQTFPSSIASAVEPTGPRRASPAAGNVHTRADSWGANTLIAPASAVEPSVRYGERKW